MKIGVLTASMSRQAGGLFWSVRSLAGRVHDIGCDLHVFAGEDEFSIKDKCVWGDIPLSIFKKKGPSGFGYQVGLSAALKNAKLDIAHVHGLWMYPSVAMIKLSRQGIPYIVSPRGMLDKWAINNSRRKKKIAGMLYEDKHLRGAACIHALCESEYEAIREYGLSNPVAIIPNGIDLIEDDTEFSSSKSDISIPDESKVLFFLSRLHPKKGLVNLLRAWAKIKKSNEPKSTPWQLLIAGWDQGGHLSDLQTLAADLNIKDDVHFVGPKFDKEKEACFKRADAFILPSYSEGLPIAVLEAWSYSLPALITKQCNLTDGYEQDAAIEIEPETNSIAIALKQLFEMSDLELKEMGSRGQRLVEKKYSWRNIAEEMFKTYKWILEDGHPPDCIRFD